MKLVNKISSIFSLLFISLTGCNNVSSNLSSSTSLNNTNISYLTSEDKGTATIKIYKDNNSTSKERYIAPKNVKMKYSYNDLSGILANNENVCPSIGDVNLLVIPVHLPGDNSYNTEEVRQDIEKAFFSKNDERLGFKSISEYYYESSYGKLNFQGEVTDWFDVSEYTAIKNTNQITDGNNGTIVTEILQKAVYWAEVDQNIDLTKYDNNKDGSIDGIWLVYDHLDYMTELELKLKEDFSYDGSDLNHAFWNYTGWDWSTYPNLDKPTTSAFSWASFSMMYTSYAKRDNQGFIDFDLKNTKLDTHVYIHETAHLLGLDDYYANDNGEYHPVGKSTMMDQNVCDLDSYSKMLLGWVTPYVVYGTSEILIPRATSSDHAVIVIPSNHEEISNLVERTINQNKIEDFVYEFNPFSEYLMIDLYTPDGLNEQDTFGQLIFRKDASINKTGVRIYHVDSRIFKAKILNYDGGQKFIYENDYVWDGYEIENDEVILMPISNQRIEETHFQLPDYFDYYDQIRLLEANQTNSFTYDGLFNKNTLFTTTTKDFSIETFGYQFFNANYKYNDGNELPFRVNVKTLKEM